MDVPSSLRESSWDNLHPPAVGVLHWDGCCFASLITPLTQRISTVSVTAQALCFGGPAFGMMSAGLFSGQASGFLAPLASWLRLCAAVSVVN